MPCTPMSESASRTSSSLKGLMMAVTIFILGSSGNGRMPRPLRLGLQGFGERDDHARLVHVAEEGLLVGADDSGTQCEAAAEVVHAADAVVHVVGHAEVLDVAGKTREADRGL